MHRLMLTLTGILLMTGACSNVPETEYPIRNTDNKFVTLETSFGNMTVELYRDVAPAHADSFYARTTDGFYQNMQIFRVIKGFMMQTGDPNNNGTGNAGYYLPAEFSDLPHIRGTLSAARGSSPNSASCQFFICFDSAPHLDNSYTVFGHVVNGMDVLGQIENVEVTTTARGEPSKPVDIVELKRAYASDAEGNPVDEGSE